MQKSMRIKKELDNIKAQPIPNINIYSNDSNLTKLNAQFYNLKDTPYENGLFDLEIQIPDRYPFEPPVVKFLTPIYHPNIDESGRICLDLLKAYPDGNWKPSLNIGTILCSIQILVANPNLDDPLKPDIAKLYKIDYNKFVATASEYTYKYARINISRKNDSHTSLKSDENNNTFNSNEKGLKLTISSSN